jgi:hypothetical protein
LGVFPSLGIECTSLVHDRGILDENTGVVDAFQFSRIDVIHAKEGDSLSQQRNKAFVGDFDDFDSDSFLHDVRPFLSCKIYLSGMLLSGAKIAKINNLTFVNFTL